MSSYSSWSGSGGFKHQPCKEKKTAAVCNKAKKSCYWMTDKCVEAAGDYVKYDPKGKQKYAGVKDARKLAWAHPTRKLSAWQAFVKKHSKDADIQKLDAKLRFAELSKRYKAAQKAAPKK